MNHCKTCKHWKVVDRFWIEVLARDPESDAWGKCTGIKPHSEIDITVDSGWIDEISTGAFFGCMAHEAKE